MTVSQFGTAYSLSGPKNAPVVVLIHGVGVTRHLWREYQQTLSDRYRVLSYDLLGHGESSRPQKTLSLSMFAEQLLTLINELHIDRCAAVGFSMGGMINRRFAMDYPERISALVIMNSPHKRSIEAQKIVEERVRKTVVGGASATIDTSLQRWFTPDFLVSKNAVIDEVRAWVLANDPRTYAETRQVLASGVTELILRQKPICTPTLVITCENDSGSNPEMAYAIGSEINGAKTVIIPNLQHLGMLEKPLLFLLPMENFLASCLH